MKRILRCSMAAGTLVVLGALTACSGGSGGGSDGSMTATGPEPAAADSGGAVGLAEKDASGGAGSTGSRAPGADRVVVRTKSVIKTGEIYLTSKDLAKVRAEVDSLLSALGGTIDSEQTSNDDEGVTEESTLVLRVPVEKFDAAKDALEKLGTFQTSDESSKDVTTEVIDVGERVETLQNSLNRLQKFQRSAQDVADLLRYEDQITARQSELQSLRAQQSYLADQTDQSTITLHLTTPEKYVPPPDALENAGFLAGLTHGWHALVDVLVVALTALGALIPFLVAGALVGVPGWVLLRRLARRRTASTPPPPAPAAP